MYRSIVIAICLLSVAATTSARTWTVERDGSGNFATLQPAVTAAADGDTVLIGPGLYTEQVEFVSPGYTAPVNLYFENKGLTLIGAGRGQTVIQSGEPGKAVPVQDNCMVIVSSGYPIEIRDLTMQNGFKGAEIHGELTMESVEILNTSHGGLVLADCGLVQIHDCFFAHMEGYAVVTWDPGIRVEMADCHQVEGQGLLYIDGGGEGFAEDCTLQSCRGGFGFISGSVGVVRRCVATDNQAVMIYAVTGGQVEVYDCEVSGEGIALDARIDGRITGSGNDLSSSRLAVLFGNSRSIIELHNCHLIRSGEAAYAVLQSYNPDQGTWFWDLSDNWWGTTDTAEISEWILDGNDDPSVSAFVVFEPFYGGPVSNEDMSWGGVKALFR